MFRYTRSPYLYSSSMTNIELSLTNMTDDDLKDVKIGAKNLAPGMSLHEFPGINSIGVGASTNVNLGINFGDTTQTAKFDLIASGRCHSVKSNYINQKFRFENLPIFSVEYHSERWRTGESCPNPRELVQRRAIQATRHERDKCKFGAS